MQRKQKVVIGSTAFIVIISIAAFLLLKKERPTHNPFDSVFNVSIDDLKDEGYIFKYGACGYNSYNRETERGRIYYQVFLDETDILAKGCDLVLDTLCGACVENTKIIEDTIINKPGLAPITEGEYSCLAIRDSLYFNIPLDTSKISERMRIFQVKLIDTSFTKDEYGMHNFKVKHLPTDSIFDCHIEINIDCRRIIRFYMGNAEPYSQKPLIKYVTSLFDRKSEEEQEFEE